MSASNLNKEKIIAFILEQQAKSGRRRSISSTEFQHDLSVVNAEIVNRAVENLEAEGTISVEWGGIFIHPYEFSTVDTTLLGWVSYAASILNITPANDAIIVSEYIRAHSPVEIDSVMSNLDLSALQIDFAIDYLESQRKVTYSHHEHPRTFTWIGG